MDFQTISRDELLALMEDGSVLVLNVLPEESYNKIHIRGSTSMPSDSIEGGRWTAIDRSKEIVVYCASYACKRSGLAASFLQAKGFRVRAYEGGMKEWAEAGYPTEGTLTSDQFLVRRYGEPRPNDPIR